MRFLHAADIHLGYQQYNLQERYNDFYYAFEEVTQTAIQHKVDICVIAGDLFHKSAVDAYTLLLAEKCLNELKQAGIRVIAVAGNHDRQRYRDELSWLHYLDRNQYLLLLEPQFFAQTDNSLVEGKSYVDVDGVRFIGIPWRGAATNAVLQRVVEDMPLLEWRNVHYTVLVTHVGVEGIIPDVPGCLKMSELSPLRQYVNYIATGHLHKPFEIDNWIHNPGAIENCDFQEEQYRKDGKGVFVVDVAEDGSSVVEKHCIPGRPFHTVVFNIDTFSAPSELSSALQQQLMRERAQWDDFGKQPVVRVGLRGNLAFDRSLINVELLRQNLQTDLDCVFLRIDMNVNGFGMDFDIGDAPTFESLEHQVFEEMARSDIRFSDRAAEWGTFMRDIRDMALREEAPEQIYQYLQTQLWGG